MGNEDFLEMIYRIMSKRLPSEKNENWVSYLHVRLLLVHIAEPQLKIMQ